MEIVDCRVPLSWACCCVFLCWCQSRSVCAGSHFCIGVRCGERDLSDRDSFLVSRIVTTLACLPACYTEQTPECHFTPLPPHLDLTSIWVLLVPHAHSPLACTRGDLLPPAPILASCWPPSGVAPLAASSSQRVIFQFHICVGLLAFLFLSHHSHHSFHHVLRFSLVCCRTRCRCGDDQFFHFAHLRLLVGHGFLYRSYLHRSSLQFSSRVVSNRFDFDHNLSLHLLALLGHHLHDAYWWVLLHSHFFSPIASRSASPALPRVFLYCWCCSLLCGLILSQTSVPALLGPVISAWRKTLPLDSVSSSAGGGLSPPSSQVCPTPLPSLIGRTPRGITFQGVPTLPFQSAPESCRGVVEQGIGPMAQVVLTVTPLLLSLNLSSWSWKRFLAFLQSSWAYSDAQSDLLLPLQSPRESHELWQVSTRSLRIRQHVLRWHPNHVVFSSCF